MITAIIGLLMVGSLTVLIVMRLNENKNNKTPQPPEPSFPPGTCVRYTVRITEEGSMYWNDCETNIQLSKYCVKDESFEVCSNVPLDSEGKFIIITANVC